MTGRPRARYWIEFALAALSGIAFIATLISREWIEVIFGVDPDGGDGSLEWVIALVLLAASVIFAMLARAEWRRAVPARGG